MKLRNQAGTRQMLSKLMGLCGWRCNRPTSIADLGGAVHYVCKSIEDCGLRLLNDAWL